MRTLITWIGMSDLRAAKNDDRTNEPGPILRLLNEQSFDEVHFLNDIQAPDARRDAASAEQYVSWLRDVKDLQIPHDHLHSTDTNLHNDYARAFEFTKDTVRQICISYPDGTRFGLLLSAGNPASQAAMLIASQILFAPGHVELFNSSRERGAERIDLPYALTADVVPTMLRRWTQRLHEAPPIQGACRIKGESPAIKAALSLAFMVAPFEESVILRGETGSGKEEFARYVHENSRRCKGPFVDLNCAAIPSELLESELFGHVRGSFTGATANRLGKIEAARRGTLFLDEIGDMRVDLQAKLLRVLQEKKYTPVGSNEETTADVRILAATHQDLQAAIAAGRFRADLYYRLNVVTVYIPPLRERGDDAGILARHFLEKFNARNGTTKRFADEAVRILGLRPWLGNVRELQNAVARLAMLTPNDDVSAEDVEQLLEPAPPLASRTLQERTPSEFAAQLVAVIDELLSRFRKPNALPWECSAETHLVKKLIEPLIFGRAVQMTRQDDRDNYTQAGLAFQKSGLDRNNKSDRERLEVYAELQSAIDERLVHQIRGGAS